MFKNLKAFTLIELLIVVAIIAILAAIAVPNFLEAQVRSKVSRVKADHRSLATALESYRVDNNEYPPNSNGPTNEATNDVAGFMYPLTTPVAYIANTLLEDPFGNADFGIGPIDGHSVYFYINLSASDPVTNAVLDLASVTGEPRENINAKNWVFASAGPDRLHEIQWAIGPPYHVDDVSDFVLWLQNAATNPDTIYDPTNGTTSRGDIGRTHKGIMSTGLAYP